MKWDEFSSLLCGLSAESPLGRMVRIRTENDKSILKHFTPQQRKIRADWQKRRVKNMSVKDSENAIINFERFFLSMAKGR